MNTDQEKLISKAIDRLQMADHEIMKYNPDWEEDEDLKIVMNLIATAHDCLIQIQKIKVSSHESIQQGANSGQLQQHVVVGRSEQLKAFRRWMIENECTKFGSDEFIVKDYLKSL